MYILYVDLWKGFIKRVDLDEKKGIFMKVYEKNIFEDRDRIIVRTSIAGILINGLLAGFKVAVGLLSNSIAIILDGVNNITDALSSLVTILGVKLSNMKPNKKHPLGYGRIEYISSMIVSSIVLYAGITALIESVKKVINPVDVEYSKFTLIVVGGSIFFKLILGTYVKKRGVEVKSNALIASGKEAILDSMVSVSILVSAVIFIFFQVIIEAYIAVFISIMITKTGFEILIDTIDDILGKRADRTISKKIKEILLKEDLVRGAHDLVISNYGANKNYASVHLELPDTMTIAELDVLTRKLQREVNDATGVILTGIGAYSYNTEDEMVQKLREEIEEIVMGNSWAINVHGFYANRELKIMRFDIAVTFDIEPKRAYEIMFEKIQKKYPDYEINLIIDIDTADF